MMMMMLLRFSAVAVIALVVLTACVTSDGKPYDLGERLARASQSARDRPPPPTVIIIRE